MKRILLERPLRKVAAGLLLAASISLAGTSALANVYASNIKLNGSVTNLTVNAGDSVTISYLLNDTASGGVIVEVLRDATLIRRLARPANGPGTSRGLNSLVWDLRDASSNSVPAGTYSVRITASATGYPDWTQINSDSDANSYVYWGRGVSIDQNPGSPYLGRVRIANSATGFSPDIFPGDNLGILQFNADGSAPDEGIIATNGVVWSGNGTGPEKIESVGTNVYANDAGLISKTFRWDQAVSSNSLLPVLRQDNRPAGASFQGLAISTEGTNTVLWQADGASTRGILKWILGADGACAPGDTGTTVIGLGSDPTGLTLAPTDVALDRNGNLYVCQTVSDSANALQRVFRFAAYDPSTNGGQPSLKADWAVGGADDTYCGASGIAVDPTGNYLAVSFQGVTVLGDLQGGNTKILSTTNGTLVTSLDASPSNLSRQHTDCAWDLAGNVYYIENYLGVWRIVSPPGTNHMATLAPASIVVAGTSTTPPDVTGITVSNGFLLITFTASPSDVPANFVVLGSSSLVGTFTAVQPANIISSGNGVFTAVIPAPGGTQFYKVERRTTPPPQQPEVRGISVSGGNVTLSFIGASTDTASAFTLLSTGSLDGTFSPVANAQFTGSAGTFQVITPTNGPVRFYRIQR